MKNLFFSLMIITLSISCVKAQNDFRRHEFNLGVGIFSTGNIVYGFADMFVQSITQAVGSGVEFSNKTASPVFHLGYKYGFSSRFTLGATLAAGVENSDFTQKGPDGTLFDTGKMNRFIGTLAPEITFNYLNANRFKLYGLAGAGCSYYRMNAKYDHADDKSSGKFLFDFQLTPLGFKFGNTFGGFAEVGFGYKGIICVGLFTKL